MGNGFDNIGDVLTISPVLMEKYLSAAERIASRAIGADPLPKKPIEVQFHFKDKRVRRVDPSTIEAIGRIEFDGDYDVRIGLPGERGADAKPVKLGFWVDGKLVHTQSAETKPSGLVYFNPYSDEQFRIDAHRRRTRLPRGLHRRRFRQSPGLTGKDIYNPKKNKYLESITFTGPFASEDGKGQPQEDPDLRSRTRAPPASIRS